MAYRIHNVGIDCNDLRRMTEFWQAVTGFEPKSADDDHTYLVAADGSFGLFMQKVPEPRTGKNRLHLDVEVADLGDAVREVTGYGATEVTRHGDGDDQWAVLADPEGNEFCLVPA
jgi:catechol 2,3-dioxygenase-like lactoylglutathione lyase family enzyme